MHKTDGAHNVDGEFIDEVIGTSPGTVVEEGWLNTVQRELVNVVEGAELTLDDEDDTQILKAIPLLHRANVISTDITMEAGKRYIASKSVSLTLPTSPVIGDSIEIMTLAQVKIIQPDAESIISWRQSLYTTKGTTGYLRLMPGDEARFIYKGSGFGPQAPLKITDPGTLPVGNGRAAGWSPDGRYLAIGHANSPYVTIYDWSTGIPVKIADPADLPVTSGQGATWSPDGRYLAMAHVATPYVTIYDWSTGAPVKIANPGTLPTNAAYSSAWSPDGRYLAIGHSIAPNVTIYDWSTGAPVKIANPGTLPTGTGQGAAWSPDGRFLAIVHTTSPYYAIYDWITGTPVKVVNLATAPTGAGYGASWSPDGRYLVIAHDTTPFITIYSCTGASIIKIADPGTLPASLGLATTWSPDGRYLVLPHGLTPFVTIYDWRTAATKEWLLEIDIKGGQVAGHQSELEYRFA